jgi:hypothetical protein
MDNHYNLPQSLSAIIGMSIVRVIVDQYCDDQLTILYKYCKTSDLFFAAGTLDIEYMFYNITMI